MHKYVRRAQDYYVKWQIATGLGVSDKTVGVQRKEMEERAEIPHIFREIDSSVVFSNWCCLVSVPASDSFKNDTI